MSKVDFFAGQRVKEQMSLGLLWQHAVQSNWLKERNQKAFDSDNIQI